MGISGRKIKKLRTDQKLSQAELAKRIGCTNSHISDLERNVNYPSAQLLVRLAEALGVTVEDLCDG